MIRNGEEYVVETPEQFIDRTEFSKLDALLGNDIAVVAEANKYAGAGEEFNSVEELPQSIIDEMFAELPSPIVPTLQADHREWIHLREGPVHRIVKLHPESGNIWAGGTITSEGVGVSLYQSGEKEPNLVDEISKPWAEVISDEDPHSWGDFQDIQIEDSDFTLK